MVDIDAMVAEEPVAIKNHLNGSEETETGVTDDKEDDVEKEIGLHRVNENS